MAMAMSTSMSTSLISAKINWEDYVGKLLKGLRLLHINTNLIHHANLGRKLLTWMLAVLYDTIFTDVDIFK